MPIGDLLASITGEKPTTTLSARPTSGIATKRKAEGDAGGHVQKAQRTTPTANGSAKTSDNARNTTRPAERPASGYTGSARPTTTSNTSSNTPRPLTEKSALSASKKSTLTSNGKPSPTSSSFPKPTRPVAPATSSAAKPSTVLTPTPAPDPNAKPPKKGSYAEIKARAAAAATKFQTMGKIQHKAIEKQPTKKEKEQAAAEEAKLGKKGLKPGSKLGAASAARNGSNGAQGNSNGAAGVGQKGLAGKSGKAAVAEERKPKKAALVSTGYTGSARLPPSKGKPGAARPSAPDKGRVRDKQPNPMGMFGSSKRRKDDEYDEDMDDFVVDDEEEEEAYGFGRVPQYKYAEDDDESDMEAGYSDVEVEETQAARLARIEDQREEAILERRRREKEKKKALLHGRR